MLQKNIYRTFNIASGSLISLLELANLITQIVKNGNVKAVKISKKPLRRFDLNCSKAHNEINFIPLINLSKGILSMKKNDIQILTK